MASFRLRAGGGATRTYSLSDGDVIGRLRSAAVPLPHESVSRHHARIHLVGTRVEVEDLGSSNGTFVNDARIVRHGLHAGDRVRFGKVELEFVEEDGQGGGEMAPSAAVLRDELGDEDWVTEDEGAGEVDWGSEDEDDELFLPGTAEPAAPAPRAAVPPSRAPQPGSEPRVEPRIEVRERRPAVDEDAAPEVGSAQRILQYRRVENRGGLLGQDLAQWSLTTKLLAVVVVLALSAGLFYLARFLGAGLAG